MKLVTTNIMRAKCYNVFFLLCKCSVLLYSVFERLFCHFYVSYIKRKWYFLEYCDKTGQDRLAYERKYGENDLFDVTLT